MKKHILTLSALISVIFLMCLPRDVQGFDFPVIPDGFTPKSVDVAPEGGVYSFTMGLVRPSLSKLIIDPIEPIEPIPMPLYYYSSYSDFSGGAVSYVSSSEGGSGIQVDVRFLRNSGTGVRTGYFILNYRKEIQPHGDVPGYTEALCDTIRFQQSVAQSENLPSQPSDDYTVSDALSSTVSGASANAVLKRVYTTAHSGSGAANGTYAASVLYYDNLGFGVQSVEVNATSSGQDLVTPLTYDYLWRENIRSYLPYASGSGGGMKSNAISQQSNYYNSRYGSVPAYTENVYENSTRGKVLSSTAPGLGAEHDTKFGENEGSSFPRLVFQNESIVVDGSYAAGSITTTSTTDADGREHRITTDGFGRKLCDESYGYWEGALRNVITRELLTASTYYIYDTEDHLRCIVSPEAAPRLPNLSSSDLTQYCYRYDYDAKDRMLSRRLPGCSWESFTYNDADQIVTHTWDDKTVTTTYDALQRPSSETLTANGTSRLLSQYTYDTYDSSASTLLNLSSLPSSDSRTMGLKTSERLAVLGTSATDYVTRAYAYDYKGRTIRTAEQYPDGSLLRTDTDYDFSGNVTSLTQQYTHGGTTDTQITTYTYDSRGRLLSETSRLNNGTAGIVNYSYDDQGRVSGKRYGSNLANESLSYGIQGWRTTQCVMQGVDSLFTTRLGYYNPHYGSRQSYTGNITESDWHHRAQPYQSYTFEYDGLNRLRTTRQYTGGAISDSDIEYPQYYDLNGNPQTLYRNSQGVRVTNFTYTYTGNQLTTLSDGSATYSYTYDSRGNMTRDGYHNLNLAYNHLNLLEKVSQNGSTVANYSYLSDGTKLSSANASGVGYVYRGSLVYGRSGNTLALESSGFGGGRLISASGSSTPHYYVTDHLGSVRVVLNNSGDIVSQHDYYPFGKSHDNPNLQTSPNRYLFNGKESQTFANVPYLDYGARMYDADVLPWLTQDPLLQNYLRFSPYVFCAGNPVKYVDKDGRKIVLVGTTAERQTSLVYLQKLTNDKLSLRSNGTVIISRMGGENVGRDLKSGSELIRNLNQKSENAKTVTIAIGEEGSGNSASTEERDASGRVDWTNSANGVGANAVVNFDPSANPEIPTLDPATGNVSGAKRPSEIGLAHELIHGKHINKGNVDFTSGTHTYQTTSGQKTQTVKKEELKTVGVVGYNTGGVTENKIREEQGLNQRGAY